MRRVSFSKISTFLRCPRLFRLRYVDREEPERLSLALPLGSAIHDCLQWEVAERGRGTETAPRPITPALRYFQQQLEAPHAFQVAVEAEYVEADCFARNGPVGVPAKTLLSQLV